MADNFIKSLPNCLFGALYVDGKGQNYFIKLLLFLVAEDAHTLPIVCVQCEEVLVKHFKASR